MTDHDVIRAADAEIVAVPLNDKPGYKTTEFGTAAVTTVLGIAGAVTEIIPYAWRWVPIAVSGLVNVAYVIARGISKRPLIIRNAGR